MQAITEHIFQLSLGVVNAFLIEDNDGTLTLVDTGRKGSADKILNTIENSGRDPHRIRQIILTHLHPDHAGSAAVLQQRLQVPVLAHALDADLIERGIGNRLPMQRTPGLINWLVYKLAIQPAGNTIEPVKIARRLQDGDQLPSGGGLQVIHTPGHSAGHISLLLPRAGVLIAADICAHAAGLALSTLYEDKALGIQSILKTTAHPFDIAVFGHGKPLKGGADVQFRQKFAGFVKSSTLA